MKAGKEGTLLGRHTPVMQAYSPEILQPIPRADGRVSLLLGDPPPFYGVDLWHAYEMSWLNASGVPVVRVGRFSIPADSPNMIESKSFKLYLNSLNNSKFASEEEARETIVADASAVAGSLIDFEFLPLDDPRIEGVKPRGECLDQLEISPAEGQPSADIIRTHRKTVVEETLFTHLLRSLCPVTGQPDWATLWMSYRGLQIDRSSLLLYVVSYREHQEFHEQCVERIFRDIHSRAAPECLHVQAFYTRRGGLDINPLRSTDPDTQPLPRMARQ